MRTHALRFAVPVLAAILCPAGEWLMQGSVNGQKQGIVKVGY